MQDVQLEVLEMEISFSKNALNITSVKTDVFSRFLVTKSTRTFQIPVQKKSTQQNKNKCEMDSYSLRYLNENKDDKIRWRSFMSITLVSCVVVNFHLG